MLEANTQNLHGDDTVHLVHGVVSGQGPLSGQRFGHAWVEVEIDGMWRVIDKSNGRDILLPREFYYDLGNIDSKKQHRYETMQAFAFMQDTGHFGPWEDGVNPEVGNDASAVPMTDDEELSVFPDERDEIGRQRQPLSGNIKRALSAMTEDTEVVSEGLDVLKYWIHPTFPKEMIKVDNAHHTQFVHQHPDWFGLPADVVHKHKEYYDAEAVLCDHTAELMYDNGWVRFSLERGNGYFQSIEVDTIKLALRMTLSAGMDIESIAVDSGYGWEEGFAVKTRKAVKLFARTGKQPSKIAQFQESTETLNELKHIVTRHGDNKEAEVYVNPSSRQLIAMLKNSEYQELRGYYDDDHVYWWDSEFLIHHAMVKELGLDYEERNRLFLSARGELDYEETIRDELEANRWIDTVFYIEEDMGWRPLWVKGMVAEGVGIITKQNQTVDVGPDETKKQAKKFGNKVTKGGVPPLLESLTTPYGHKWIQMDDDRYVAQAKTDNDDIINIEFDDDTISNAPMTDWSMAFTRNDSISISGTRDAFRILATVLAATKEFIEIINPSMLNFTAEKPGVRRGFRRNASGAMALGVREKGNSSRSNLYKRMVRQYIDTTKYSIETQETSDRTSFIITKKDEITESKLLEYVEYVSIPRRGIQLKVLVNPPANMLASHLQESSMKELRGFYDEEGNKVYWWDAAYAIHVEMCKKLGLEYQHMGRLEMSSDGELLFEPENREFLQDIRWFKKNFDVSVKNGSFGAPRVQMMLKGMGIQEEKISLPDLETDDEMMVGKFKNRKATITGFKKDKNNQPIAKTDKGDQQIFKGRIKKLMPDEKLDEVNRDDMGHEVDDIGTSYGLWGEPDDLEWVGKIGKYPVALNNIRGQYNRREIMLYTPEKHEPIAAITLYREGKTWITQYSRVLTEYQGMSLGYRLYKFCIEKLGYTLQSDKTQTPGSAKAWAKLFKTRGINVYSYRLGKKNNRFQNVEIGPDGHLHGAHDEVYSEPDRHDNSDGMDIEDDIWAYEAMLNTEVGAGRMSEEDAIKLMRKANKSYRQERDDYNKAGYGTTLIATSKKLVTEDQMGPQTPSVQQIAKMHDVPIKQIRQQLLKGINVEKEHTENETLASEIARDHLAEFPDYYDRLKKVEENITGDNIMDHDTELQKTLKELNDIQESISESYLKEYTNAREKAEQYLADDVQTLPEHKLKTKIRSKTKKLKTSRKKGVRSAARKASASIREAWNKKKAEVTENVSVVNEVTLTYKGMKYYPNGGGARRGQKRGGYWMDNRDSNSGKSHFNSIKAVKDYINQKINDDSKTDVSETAGGMSTGSIATGGDMALGAGDPKASVYANPQRRGNAPKKAKTPKYKNTKDTTNGSKR